MKHISDHFLLVGNSLKLMVFALQKSLLLYKMHDKRFLFMRLLAVFTLFVMVFSPVLYAQNLSDKQVAEDLNYLKGQLQELHPGFNRYTSQEAMDIHFEEMEKLGECSFLDFFARVRYLVGKVGCGHTNASPTTAQYNEFVASRLFIPLMVRFSGDQLYITNAELTNGKLNAGDRIVSINGTKVAEMIDAIFKHLPSDGNIETGKYRYMENFFYYYHQLFVDDSKSFEVEVVHNGVIKTVNIEGVELNEVEALREANNEALMSLDHYSDCSYMRIRTFSSSALSQAGINYEKFLSDSFDDIKDKRVKNLILDLRGNGGGDDNYGATLVSYFAKKPFRYFDNIQVTSSYNGYGKITERDGVRYMTSHKGLEEWKPKRDGFSGNLIVLIDGFSFSTCADVATVLHHNGWATFVGEETGGGYDGNSSGSMQTVTLPNSNIQVRIPMWQYTTANVGHSFYGRGVIPDYPVQYSIEDYLQYKDPVMEKALELVK